MTNGGIIEGRTEYSGCSDLSLVTSYAGQHSNTAHASSIRLTAKGRMARSGEMHGLLACKELQSLPHCSRNLGNPYVDKEARLRPQHFTFGSGETRMQMREALGGIKGPFKVLHHLAPNYFMKYLVLLVIGASVSYGQSFEATVYDYRSGQIRDVVRGSVEQPYKPYQPQIDAYKRIIADTQASIDRMRAESEARAQLRELREQTELLRKIANE